MRIMKIPKNITVKDYSDKTIAVLSPISDGLKDCYSDCRLNGESTLEFMLPADSPKIATLTPECTIWAGGRVYSLLSSDAVDLVRDEKNALWAKFMAVERWKNLETSFIEPSLSNDPTIPFPADLAVIIVGGGSNLSGGVYATGTAAHALYAILQGSGWSLGTCDVPGIHDLEAEKVSRLELIKMVQEIWGGYLVWDSVNKTVSLRSGNNWQNYTGFQIRYAKNLKHITRTQSNRLITKLYAFGKDDLDIAAVNSGKKYVTNFSFTPQEYVGIYRNQDITDPLKLKEKAIDELSLNCRPRYLYKVRTVDLRTLPEYSHEDFTLGDMVDVIDPTIAPDKPRVRIIRHKYNLFRPWECELDIGDPEERLIEQLKTYFDVASYIDDILTSRGQLSGYRLVDGSIPSAKIINLEAGKITAGTITAEISIMSPKIYGAYLEVGTTAAGKLKVQQGSSNWGELSFQDSSENPAAAIHYSTATNTLQIADANNKTSIYIMTTEDLAIHAGNGIEFSTPGPFRVNGANIARENWVNTNFAPASHSHPEYSLTSHTHQQYAIGDNRMYLQVYNGHLEVFQDGSYVGRVLLEP